MLDDEDNDAIEVALSSQASCAIKDLEGGDVMVTRLYLVMCHG